MQPHAARVPLSKRLLDKAVAGFALLMLLPLMLIVAVLVLLVDGGPAIFGHERVGINGRRFRCYKFRSMVRDADAQLARILASDPAARAEWETTRKLTVDPRVSRLGLFLRRTSLDELPQLWNVLRGDMSLVGPRPVTADEAVRYGDHFATYSAVRPGITGAWQVSGRNEISYPERVDLDVHYVTNWSLACDLGILLKTVNVVLTGRGAS
ncbi:Exopolysaccharide production protein exoY [Profundibacterium mesophilum KAUST100406-0324]|uniref:Exopolysaccharide production protein exoY n=2 Tax=Profundibacterium TaxID=1258570 RepID=A0A921NUK5_9RHOB|nr:Exopolysaccharide production protein exoY [Profundibacterium mesophilum KAUST100406-0324]